MGDVFLDALTDSLIVLAFLLPINVIVSVAEPHLAGKIKLKGRFAPLVGVTVGLFPQCGFSVVATDLYQKRHITVGNVVFFALFFLFSGRFFYHTICSVSKEKHAEMI